MSMHDDDGRPHVRLVDGKIVLPTIKMKMIDYKPKIDTSAAMALLDHMSQALGIPDEVRDAPITPYSEYQTRHAAAVTEAAKTITSALFSEWEAEVIVYEDEHYHHVVPLRGRMLLPTRIEFTFGEMK